MTEYELWSVLGQWAGAIATTLAVIVALWTARLPYSKKLKISCGSAFAVGLGHDEFYYIVTATNIGQRDIQITMIGLLIENKQLFIPATIGECQKIIKTAESVNHQLAVEELKRLFIKNKFNKNSNIFAFTRDGDGKQYKKRLNMKVKDIIKSY